MINVAFDLTGNIPSKKNSRSIYVKRGRVINTPSKNYKEWHEYAMWQLKMLKVEALKPPYAIYVKFYMRDNRRTDLDNKFASIADLLQDAGIIEDDCWQKLTKITLEAGGIHKGYPKAHIVLSSEINKPGEKFIVLSK